MHPPLLHLFHTWPGKMVSSLVLNPDDLDSISRAQVTEALVVTPENCPLASTHTIGHIKVYKCNENLKQITSSQKKF